ncbi:hypothetical protein I4F81_009253 [Pyropia yezoensis]|uniref:Uncharacterized protein n=1 Tax=Pyropia yezoensis TaxID=2788 RepID=A0ACC3C9J4_PYRYE|nr:hypothetical protein I4F81_009253 [Neopyropia yezoensis]
MATRREDITAGSQASTSVRRPPQNHIQQRHTTSLCQVAFSRWTRHTKPLAAAGRAARRVRKGRKEERRKTGWPPHASTVARRLWRPPCGGGTSGHAYAASHVADTAHCVSCPHHGTCVDRGGGEDRLRRRRPTGSPQL